MAAVAGVNLPCTDCALRFKRCSCQTTIFEKVFFAIGRPVDLVECKQYEPAWYHGLEGVRV